MVAIPERDGADGMTNTKSITIRAVGDVCLQGVDGDPFDHVAGELEADLLIGNLECALTSRVDGAPRKIVFSAPPDSAEHLARRRFDLVCLANNHVLDFGAEGLLDTLKALEERGVGYFGAGRNAAEARRIVYLERNGLRIAILSAADAAGANAKGPTISVLSLRALAEAVKEARSGADLVIVSYHGGIELELLPSPFVVRGLRGLVDAGADVVLAHHPHVLQPVEIYKDRLIAYSLGNFVFDNSRYGEKASLAAMGAILHLAIRFSAQGDRGWGVQEIDHRYVPVSIGGDRKPTLLTAVALAEFERHIRNLESRLVGVNSVGADVKRMDNLARQFHRKSTGTIIRYAVRHLRDFSAREILLGAGLVLKHTFGRRSASK